MNGVRTQADSPRERDKDFFPHILAAFSVNALFGVNPFPLLRAALKKANWDGYCGMQLTLVIDK